MTEPLRILSLGAGVQSTTVLLMSLAGELPRLDAAVFADTGWEPTPVYEHFRKVTRAAEQAGVPVYTVSKGNIRRDAVDPAAKHVKMPFFVPGPDGRAAIVPRECTREYKIRPIGRKIRELRDAVAALAEATGKPHVEQWFGISLDEAVRMRTSKVGYITNVYPLVDKRMTRWDCQRWLTAHGWPDVPKSACIGCPFHSDAAWRRLRDEDPAGWVDAVTLDRELRTDPVRAGAAQAKLRGPVYLHRSLKPLDQVDLSTPEDHGQLTLLDGFAGECEGMCGL